jgi:putative cell wall-binding protein
LLTGSDTLNKTTLQEIQRLKANNVFILGGTGVISQGIEDELKKIYNVIRLADTNRHKTAFAIGEYAMKLRKADTAILTTGDNYPDALAIAPFSAKYGYPIVFNRVAEDSYHVHQEVLDYLKKWNIKNIIIVGGYNVVSEFIGVQLRKVGMNVVRLEGDNRYLTSLEIARYFAGIMQYNGVIVATGNNFVDALAGSSYAAKIGCPILLVDKDNVEEDIRGFVSRQSIKDVFVLGGDSVVSEMVIDKLREGK